MYSVEDYIENISDKRKAIKGINYEMSLSLLQIQSIEKQMKKGLMHNGSELMNDAIRDYNALRLLKSKVKDAKH